MLMKPDFKYQMDLLDPQTGTSHNLYREVEDFRKRRALDAKIGSVDQQLQDIASEVITRVKITQQEIFFIGELLVQAREILKEDNDRSFPDWVNEKFEFGYHTALNFCRVYTACVGRREYIKYVKPSILYQISAKSFPEELRDVLLINDMLKDIKNAELKKIYKEFQEKGFEAVKLKLEDVANKSLIVAHVAPFEDNLNKVRYEIQKSIDRLKDGPGRRTGLSGIKGATEIGNEIATLILNSFKECLDILDDAFLQATKKFNVKIQNPTPCITFNAQDGNEIPAEIVNEMPLPEEPISVEKKD